MHRYVLFTLLIKRQFPLELPTLFRTRARPVPFPVPLPFPLFEHIRCPYYRATCDSLRATVHTAWTVTACVHVHAQVHGVLSRVPTQRSTPDYQTRAASQPV